MRHSALGRTDAARFRAFRKAILGILNGRDRGLASMDEALAARPSRRRARAGYRGRRRRNDRHSRPPHRVSVARSLGRDTINARVIDVNTKAPLGPEVDARALLRTADSGISWRPPNWTVSGPRRGSSAAASVPTTSCSGTSSAIAISSASRGDPKCTSRRLPSWFDSVYSPVANEIREHEVLEKFPGWTEADIAEITRRWLELGKAGEAADPATAVSCLLVAKDARKWWQRRKSLGIQM